MPDTIRGESTEVRERGSSGQTSAVQSRYRRPSRRGALVAAAVVVLVSIVLAVALRGGDDDDGNVATPPADEALERFGSDEVDDVEPLPESDALDAYRISYRVTQRGVSHLTTEVLTVVRPFTSELETRDADDARTGVNRWAFGRVITGIGEEQPRVFAVGPNVGSYDLRPQISVDEAVERGLLDRREQREVVGRRCQVYRAATTVSEGVLEPLDAASGEYADVCLDADGLLLEEWWVVDGNAIRQRVATAIADEVPRGFGDGWSDEATSEPAGEGGGSVIRLLQGSAPPGVFFEAPSAPAGFTHLGRYSVIPPQAIDVQGADQYKAIASTADVWRSGVDVLVLDQGGSLGGGAVFPPDPDNRTVDLPGIGTAEVVLGLSTNEVRIPRDGGKYVRVIGTLPSDDLLAFARTLVETQGNEIVADDGPLLR
jgi:hypothetical protein